MTTQTFAQTDSKPDAAMPDPSILRATLVSHTHWDRAWYVTFQEYRLRLVRLIDRMIAILEADSGFSVFMLDGQMSVLDDYLEARPSQAEKLQTLAKSGRIVVGPWFVLADEFLVSPEALIRNLALGHKLGEAYGGVAKIGYVPDGFGHIAQLPQILQGFGIDNAFFWRGMGVEGDSLGTEFLWKSPDESAVTTVLMPWGYHNVTNLGYGIHWGDTSQMDFNPDLAIRKIHKAVGKLEHMTNTGTILLMNGIDHAEAEPRVPAIIGHANDDLDNVFIEHGTLADHLSLVRTQAEAKDVTLPEFSGEFRWGRYSEILQGVYSTRIHLKQQNHAHEVLLERYMEPICALAWVFGAPIDEGIPDMLALAWRWLLLNHPHDDMYGSGIDEVHAEMAYRFSQARQIADYLVRDHFRLIGREMSFNAQPGTPILLFNPLGNARHDLTEALIEFDFDDPTADKFQIVDSRGAVVLHQVIADEQRFWMEVLKPNRKRCVTVLIDSPVPACGFTTLYVQPRTSQPDSSHRVVRIENGAENVHLSFTIATDGGLTVTHKATGRTYTGLNHFHDIDDAGDEYSSCPSVNSQTVSTVGVPAAILCIEDGDLRVGFRIHWNLMIPVALKDDRVGRSVATVVLPISTEIRLEADSPALHIVTTIDNQARDHKLSVAFPTGLQTDHALVDESFLIARRDLKLPESKGWVEDPTPLMHQRASIALGQDASGLAILNRGLPSVEAHPDGTIYLTLLRAVGWLSRDDLATRRIAAGPLVPTPGAQCIGPYRYEYAILPHTFDAGSIPQVHREAYRYTVQTYARRADTHPGLDLREMNITRDDLSLITVTPWPRTGSIEDGFSLITIDDNTPFALSAVYRNGDALIVRLYNLSDTTVTGRVRLGMHPASITRVRLDETQIAPLTLNPDSTLTLTARGCETITLRLVLAQTTDHQ